MVNFDFLIIIYLYTLAFSVPLIFGSVLDTKETRKATILLWINHFLISISFYYSFYYMAFGPILSSYCVFAIYSFLAPFICKNDIKCFCISLLIPIVNASASIFTIILYRWVNDFFFNTFKIIILPFILLCFAFVLLIRTILRLKKGVYKKEEIVVPINSFKIKQIIKAFVLPILFCSVFFVINIGLFKFLIFIK